MHQIIDQSLVCRRCGQEETDRETCHEHLRAHIRDGVDAVNHGRGETTGRTNVDDHAASIDAGNNLTMFAVRSDHPSTRGGEQNELVSGSKRPREEQERQEQTGRLGETRQQGQTDATAGTDQRRSGKFRKLCR